MKKALKLIAVLGISALVLVACGDGGGGFSIPPNGVGIGEGRGYAFNPYFTIDYPGAPQHPIIVQVTIANGELTNVSIIGLSESANEGLEEFGQAYILKAIPVIYARAAVNLKTAFNFSMAEVDATSAATSTHRGIRQAGNRALRNVIPTP